MPFTPEANLANCKYFRLIQGRFSDILNKLLGLNVAHAMDTSNTVTISNRSVKSYLNFGTLQFITVIANFYDGLSCYYGLTQQTKHARFRLNRPLPALHEFFAQGWKRLQ